MFHKNEISIDFHRNWLITDIKKVLLQEDYVYIISGDYYSGYTL